MGVWSTKDAKETREARKEGSAARLTRVQRYYDESTQLASTRRLEAPRRSAGYNAIAMSPRNWLVPRLPFRAFRVSFMSFVLQTPPGLRL